MSLGRSKLYRPYQAVLAVLIGSTKLAQAKLPHSGNLEVKEKSLIFCLLMLPFEMDKEELMTGCQELCKAKVQSLLQVFQDKLLKMDEGISMNMKVAVTFKGSNYLVWSRMVRNTVGSKGLWKHLTDGEAPKLITQGEDSEEVSNETAVEKTRMETEGRVMASPWWHTQAIQTTEEVVKTSLGDQTFMPSSKCLRKTVTLVVIPLVHQ
ncbi:hypothetical protein F2Q68_00041877 [Brassica cretica]|uniref:Uncharacterized protein n=1 Tax=Brassica cretica TaxID=69181 RepID=A0A8S9MIT2_BRACR|nr:hypothetical protein F2Q68_00041877 [Brassica cretica]